MEAYRLLYRSRVGMEHAREILAAGNKLMPELQVLFEFIENSQLGRHGRGGAIEKSSVSKLKLAVIGAGHLGKIHCTPGQEQRSTGSRWRCRADGRSSIAHLVRTPATYVRRHQAAHRPVEAAIVATTTVYHYDVTKRPAPRRRACAGRKTSRFHR